LRSACNATILAPSAKSAVRTLKHLVERIEEEGLLTGRDEADDYVVESVDGRLSS